MTAHGQGFHIDWSFLSVFLIGFATSLCATHVDCPYMARRGSLSATLVMPQLMSVALQKSIRAHFYMTLING